VTKGADARRLQQAIVDLHRIVNSRRLHDTRAARSGVEVTPVAARVLRHVVDDGTVRPGELADRLRMRPNALSRHLKSLEADRCIERVPAPGDGRGALLRPTRRGRTLVQRLEAADDEILAEQLRSWSAADLHQLVTLFDRLVHDLRAPAPAAGAPARARRTTTTSEEPR
jgi:DNA-binding MarR family transcriptional regulator